jgi:transcriptional regulator with XRE-family HTH domain
MGAGAGKDGILMPNPHPKLKVKVKRRQVYSWAVRHNITLATLAEKLKISPAYFSQLLHGRRYPNGRHREHFLKVMKPLTWEDLFQEDFK